MDTTTEAESSIEGINIDVDAVRIVNGDAVLFESLEEFIDII